MGGLADPYGPHTYTVLVYIALYLSQILFGLGLPLLLLQRVDGLSSKGLVTVGLYYIGFHSLKVR